MANKDKGSGTTAKKRPQKNLKQKREAKKAKKGTSSGGSGWDAGGGS